MHHVTLFPLPQAPCALAGVEDDECSMDLEDNGCCLSGASQVGRGTDKLQEQRLVHLCHHA